MEVADRHTIVPSLLPAQDAKWLVGALFLLQENKKAVFSLLCRILTIGWVSSDFWVSFDIVSQKSPSASVVGSDRSCAGP